jgi:hypothetical protein
LLPSSIKGSPMTDTDLITLRARLGPADEAQIRLLLRVSPAQRLLTMLEMQDLILDSWRDRLRRSHPDLNDLDLTRLLFDRLQGHG